MSHAHGTKLAGSIACLESLRERCVICGDCWHLRTANGRPLPDDKRHVIWVHGKGLMTAARASWFFRAGRLPLRGHRVVRTCGSYDCVAPTHLRAMSHADYGALMKAQGRTNTARKTIANRVQGLRRSRVSVELRQWIAESTQTLKDMAHALDVAPSHVHQLRRKAQERMGS
jgi:hypothetical protein